jgi:hypothetical protein
MPKNVISYINPLTTPECIERYFVVGMPNGPALQFAIK